MQLQRLLSYTRKAVDEYSMIQEGALSNCRVQLALSPKKDGMIITLPFTHLTSLLWGNEGLSRCYDDLFQTE